MDKKERQRQYQRGYEARNREKTQRAKRDASYRKLYGITLEEYEAMLEVQGGVCAMCGGTQERALNVDHCHETGRVRALLCTPCNGMLGNARDSIENLERGITYLRKYR